MVDRVAAAAGVLYGEVVRPAARKKNAIPLFDLRNSPGASSDSLLATLALPDSDRVSLDGVLAAEGADVSCVLGDFHLLDLLSEGSTVASAVFTGHTDLCELLMGCPGDR